MRITFIEIMDSNECGMNPVAMTIINALKEYCPNRGSNQRPPVLKYRTLRTERPNERHGLALLSDIKSIEFCLKGYLMSDSIYIGLYIGLYRSPEKSPSLVKGSLMYSSEVLCQENLHIGLLVDP